MYKHTICIHIRVWKSFKAFKLFNHKISFWVFKVTPFIVVMLIFMWSRFERTMFYTYLLYIYLFLRYLSALKSLNYHFIILWTGYIKFATKFVTPRRKRWRPYKIYTELSWFRHIRLSVHLYIQVYELVPQFLSYRSNLHLSFSH